MRSFKMGKTDYTPLIIVGGIGIALYMFKDQIKGIFGGAGNAVSGLGSGIGQTGYAVGQVATTLGTVTSDNLDLLNFKKGLTSLYESIQRPPDMRVAQTEESIRKSIISQQMFESRQQTSKSISDANAGRFAQKQLEVVNVGFKVYTPDVRDYAKTVFNPKVLDSYNPTSDFRSGY